MDVEVSWEIAATLRMLWIRLKNKNVLNLTEEDITEVWKTSTLLRIKVSYFLLFDLGQRALTLLSSCHFNPQSTPKFSSIAIILKPWLCINKEIHSCFMVINLHCFNEFLIFYTNYSIWVFYSVYTYIKR